MKIFKMLLEFLHSSLTLCTTIATGFVLGVYFYDRRKQQEWEQEVKEKVDAAVEASEHIPPVDGETFVRNILKRFKGDR